MPSLAITIVANGNQLSILTSVSVRDGETREMFKKSRLQILFCWSRRSNQSLLLQCYRVKIDVFSEESKKIS